MDQIHNKKAMLVILDGVGIRKSKKCNAVKLARMTFFDDLYKRYPHTVLGAAEGFVGLEKGYIGNSEVGHLTLGSGQIIDQDLTRINKMLRDKSFYKNKAISDFLNTKKSETVHIIGLWSDAGVHSHINHIIALIEMAFRNDHEVRLHFLPDGRDTEPYNSPKYMGYLIAKANLLSKKYKQYYEISTIIGRYYAMDRNNNWDRTKKAFDLIYYGRAKNLFSDAKSLQKYIESEHKKKRTDEFIQPAKLYSYAGIEKDDKIIFANFREDRMRQLCRLVMKKHRHSNILTMSEYDKRFKLKTILRPVTIKNNLASVLSAHKLKQYHIAETEKYAHVTYFFNSGIEKPYSGERRLLIPSPNVATYDLKPEMSAQKITDALLKNAHKYDFVVVNYANGDMVGHTGNVPAAVKAMRFIDVCLKRLYERLSSEFTFFIVADHGNCEEMLGKYKTSHTLNPVRFMITDKDVKLRLSKGLGLSSVAPTVLKYMGIAVPKEMKNSLI